MTLLMSRLGMLSCCFAASLSAQASLIQLSPVTSTTLPSEVPEIGGILMDAIGANGVRLLSYLPSEGLYKGVISRAPEGQPDVGETVVIGTDSGIDNNLLAELGGGFSQIGIRLSLWDGDTALGDPDYNQNYLLVNGITFGNFSDIETEARSRDGSLLLGNNIGFGNDQLGTGWFWSDDKDLLSQLFRSTQVNNSITYSYEDRSKSDNFVSFGDTYANDADRPLTQIFKDVESGSRPGAAATAVSEPGIVMMLLAGLFALALRRQPTHRSRLAL